ncbi:conserved hypothetical protein [Crenothrix polyspora]|uniref:Sulfatase-modifying factor enzyme-like domain-containing protein n=1 Tax=Crenothrix polyspora TaxID=360316 RepID=A0A1R4H0A7_9GAMM|nr:SUMF1/EgtB/PvdO family nonheme iron enzyme [Crenothrix polyspora]SJM89646.1 conserved hypothetical protein [Crenothrix polyspora]
MPFEHQWHDNYTNTPLSETVATNASADRVLRGGSWINDGSDARSAARFKYEPTHHDGYIGFRLALGS